MRRAGVGPGLSRPTAPRRTPRARAATWAGPTGLRGPPPEGALQLLQALEVPVRRLGPQLLAAAEAITHGRAGQAVVARADQVVLAVADHQCAAGLQRLAFHQVGDQVALVGAGAVQLAAVDAFEVLVEGEVPGDLRREHGGFAGGDEQPTALLAQLFEQRMDAVEGAVLVQAGGAKALAVVVHGLPGALLVHAIRSEEHTSE